MKRSLEIEGRFEQTYPQFLLKNFVKKYYQTIVLIK